MLEGIDLVYCAECGREYDRYNLAECPFCQEGEPAEFEPEGE